MMRQRARGLARTGRLVAALLLVQSMMLMVGCGKPTEPTPGPQNNGGQAKNEANTKPAGALAALVPADADAFGAVRVSALWKNPAIGDVKKMAGVDADGAGIEAMTGLKPQAVEYVGMVGINRLEAGVFFVVTHEEVDRKAILQKMMPKGRKASYKGKEYYFKESTFAQIGAVIGQGASKPPEPKESEWSQVLYFAGPRALVLGQSRELKAYLDSMAKSSGAGELSAALALASKHDACVAAKLYNLEYRPRMASMTFESVGETIEVPGKRPPEKPKGKEEPKGSKGPKGPPEPANPPGPKVVEKYGPFPPELVPYKPILAAKLGVLTLDVGATWKARAELTFADDAQAKANKDLARKGLDEIAGLLEVILQGFGPAAAMLSKPVGQVQTGLQQATVQQSGKTLSTEVSAPINFGADAAVLDRLKQAEEKRRFGNNLRQIMISIHNYMAFHNDQLPPLALCDKNGKPQLSWRVLLLPLIEEEELFRQFKLDEPWDSPNNKKLIARMPRLYALPGVKVEPGMTHYRIFQGPGTLYPNGKAGKSPYGPGLLSAFSLTTINDGASNTIFVAEAADPVIWTKPDELVVAPKKPLPKLGATLESIFRVGMMDGSVHQVNKKISPVTLRNAINPTDGNPLGKDW